MKTIQALTIVVIVSSTIILLYSAVIFAQAERYFNSGWQSCKAGSNCPFPDFQGLQFYGMIGLAAFAAGAILYAKTKTILTRTVLGVASLVSGIPALVIGILSYLNDYNHYVSIMEKCSNVPCMTPIMFADIQYVVFFATYGAILSALGAFLFVTYFRRKNRK